MCWPALYDEVLANYPGFTVEDVRACVGYAKDVLAGMRVLPTVRPGVR